MQFLFEIDGDLTGTESRLNRFFEDFASESLIRDGFIKSKMDLYNNENAKEIFDYFSRISLGTLNNLAKIDEAIVKLSKNWSLERMPRIDRNLLRMSIYEILSVHEIPRNVAINESIEIAKKYGNSDSPSFINGILDAVIKNQ